MSSFQLTEKTRKLLLDEIKANISSALAAVRTDRNDASVTTEPPRKYFIYDGPNTFEYPCLFVVVDSAEFPEEALGNNFPYAYVKVYVAVVVEDRDKAALVIKSERYQAALFSILHRKTLNDTIDNVKLYSRVVRLEFSPVITDVPDKTKGTFQKEVVLELEVRHAECP